MLSIHIYNVLELIRYTSLNCRRSFRHPTSRRRRGSSRCESSQRRRELYNTISQLSLNTAGVAAATSVAPRHNAVAAVTVRDALYIL